MPVPLLNISLLVSAKTEVILIVSFAETAVPIVAGANEITVAPETLVTALSDVEVAPKRATIPGLIPAEDTTTISVAVAKAGAFIVTTFISL